MNSKVLALWYVLIGKPVIYKTLIDGAYVNLNNKPYVSDSTFKNCLLETTTNTISYEAFMEQVRAKEELK